MVAGGSRLITVSAKTSNGKMQMGPSDLLPHTHKHTQLLAWGVMANREVPRSIKVRGRRGRSGGIRCAACGVLDICVMLWNQTVTNG